MKLTEELIPSSKLVQTKFIYSEKTFWNLKALASVNSHAQVFIGFDLQLGMPGLNITTENCL